MVKLVYFGQNGSREEGKLQGAKVRERSFVGVRSKFHGHTTMLSAIRDNLHSLVCSVEPRSQYCDLIPCPKARFPAIRVSKPFKEIFG